jgi:predicted RNA-binding Zn-ribbon protein involved in translation (DUF1610 family)
MGRNVVFKCPETGLSVQHWLDTPPPDDERKTAYISVACPACTNVHFINTASGRLLGEDKK